MSFLSSISKKLLSCFLVLSLAFYSCCAQEINSQSEFAAGQVSQGDRIIKESFFSVLGLASVAAMFVAWKSDDQNHWAGPVFGLGMITAAIALINLFGVSDEENSDECGPGYSCHNHPCHACSCCAHSSSWSDDAFWSGCGCAYCSWQDEVYWTGCNCGGCKEEKQVEPVLEVHEANQGLRDAWDDPELY